MTMTRRGFLSAASAIAARAAAGAVATDPDEVRPATREETFPIALHRAKFFHVELVEILRQKLEFRQEIELHFLGQGSHLGGADLIENDLKHGGKILLGAGAEGYVKRGAPQSAFLNSLRFAPPAVRRS